MRAGEAFAFFGLEPSASWDEARRTYMRRVKTVRPETDPEEFKKVRQAWESLEEHFEKPSFQKVQNPVVAAGLDIPPFGI